MTLAPTKVKVSDPFEAVTDAGLPALRLALAPYEVEHEFKRGLPRLAGETGFVLPRAVRVVRHKPGRRCVIEYDVKIDHDGIRSKKLTLIGKVRARRFGNEGYRQLDAVWDRGFQADSADGISVPEPVGVIPRFQMWLQRKVRGESADVLLAGGGGVALAGRVAEAIHKLHRAGVPTDRQHTMADELRILHEHVPVVGETQPALMPRLKRVLAACDRLGARVPAPRGCGIHRDFYPAQVVVDGARLYLLDFDLYCQGDPGLDVGNFIGHMIEESLRLRHDAGALADREAALTERFLELAGPGVRAAVTAYTTLTLVRHIYLSTQFAERRAHTEAILELCERRLEDGK